MKPAYRIIALAALVVLTACGEPYDIGRISSLNGPQAVGSPFSRYMAQEYRDLSRSIHTGLFSRAFGSVDARKRFVHKGQAAADGVIVMPEMPGDWSLNGADFAEIAQARADLVEALDNGGRDLAPDKAAIAQARFDCWAAGQERTRNNDSSCKRQFKKVLRVLQSSLSIVPATSAAATARAGSATASGSAADEFPPPITTAASGSAGSGPGFDSASGSIAKGTLAPVQQAMFIVFFDWDKTSLSSRANDILDAIAEELKARQDMKKISVIGHADTSGGEKYNKTLSLKRAYAVRDALIARGAPRDKISAEGRGEGDLLVKTPDNVREPGNRRAQITLE
ncbi:MAG: OmpA family protein [Alphaproteobacteria bacterium]|nr:OmpA family protein [Alphaproteobacteria bacterium]